MEEILILDACSIINLMRIDTDEEFLGNWIRKTNPYIAETVIKEVNANYKKTSTLPQVKQRASRNSYKISESIHGQ